MNRPAWVALVLCALALPAAAEGPAKLSEPELIALLERIEQAFSPVQSLEAPFTQEKHLAMFSEPATSEGVCLFIRPDRVRLETLRPFRSVLAVNGKSVAKYEFIRERWKKLEPGSPDAVLMVTGQIASWLEGRLRAQGGLYAFSAVAGDRIVLTLTPRHEKMRALIAAIDLEFPADLRQLAVITLHEPGGDYTRIRFDTPRQNVALPEALFDTRRPVPAPWTKSGEGFKQEEAPCGT